MSQCPHCGFATREPDDGDRRIVARQEIQHMEQRHPEIIRARLEAAGIRPNEFMFRRTPDFSSELDEISVDIILATVKAIRGANEMAEQLLAKDAKAKAYVANHDMVADALTAYCRRRLALGRA